ncbi:FkbM family methyltransferase [Ancylobacter sp. WKF20]|uniref:FkbM family methyltransferase n=1 Tax=Ancylobacter sp. WKF20 TaxID=3039801 RepID=UPI00243460AF|nr:FkbM family methyltransferase [Ancylobacter sp. WKF20]WGD29853.1 FkbM family methyltransferase [Ancylobacter sp. WKF20]
MFWWKSRMERLLNEVLPSELFDIRRDGIGSIELAGRRLDLDLSHVHERRYLVDYLFKRYNPDVALLSALINTVTIAGDSVLDVGANIGLTALLFLGGGARSVTAVEPKPDLFERLKRLDPAVSVIPSALNNTSGTVQLAVAAHNNETHTLMSGPSRPRPPAAVSEYIPVSAMTLDDVCPEEHFNIWKLSVEGAEVRILDGARGSFYARPPRCIIVTSDQDRIRKIAKMLAPTHPYQYRALLRSDACSLTFVPVSLPHAHVTFEPTKQIFVFMSISADSNLLFR